jgi:hypothetical protein
VRALADAFLGEAAHVAVLLGITDGVCTPDSGIAVEA